MELRALISFAGVVSAKKGEEFTCDERIGKSLVEAQMAEVVEASVEPEADDTNETPEENAGLEEADTPVDPSQDDEQVENVEVKTNTKKGKK